MISDRLKCFWANVDLPEPDGPTRRTSAGSGIDRFTCRLSPTPDDVQRVHRIATQDGQVAFAHPFLVTIGLDPLLVVRLRLARAALTNPFAVGLEVALGDDVPNEKFRCLHRNHPFPNG